ncbi:hypothetical protein JRQ81_004272 [Phrynocephalus forsythii]|uniref:C-type lectin domain-containing protein n=1 Tax=Phrynocephalus forsythii TaxID=171643 RepID=A0A9Q0XGZ6_9SAUR|nr:hypothetical protein JRQ81_004272 [Phrynocephalus forsythii]
MADAVLFKKRSSVIVLEAQKVQLGEEMSAEIKQHQAAGKQVNQKMALFTHLALCLLGIIFSNPFLGVEADTCAREWLQNQGNCYAYFDHPLSWQEAEVRPFSQHPSFELMHSPSLSTSQPVLVCHNLPKSPHSQISLVSLSLNKTIYCVSLLQTRKWRWADESTYNYKAWMISHPDNYHQNEHCVELRFSTGFTQWNDVACRKQNAYICKHEL